MKVKTGFNNKKMCALLTSMIMGATVLPMGVTAEDDLLSSKAAAELTVEYAAPAGAVQSSQEKANSGSCGANVNYSYSNGVLTISGKGEMDPQVWMNQKEKFASTTTKVVVKPGVTKICASAFAEFKRLQTVSLPEGLQDIRIGAFCDCSKLKTVNLPKSLKEIPRACFAGCSSLTSIVIPDSIRGIGNDAFYQTGLKSVTIPKSVTIIGYYAFRGNDALKDIYYTGSKTEWNKIQTNSSFDTVGGQNGAIRPTIHYGVGGGSSETQLARPTFNAQKPIEFLTNGLKIKWNKVNGAAKYRVMYRVAGTKKWLVATDTTSTSAALKKLVSGKTYEFAVRCVNAAGDKYTSEAGYSKKQLYVEAPKVTYAGGIGTSMRLKWKALSGAAKYRVFYRVSGTKAWKTAGETEAAQFDIKNLVSGKTYDFTVRCMNASGQFVSTQYAPGKTSIHVTAPTARAVKASKGVKITWNKVAGATGYRVMRKAANGQWEIIKTISSSSTLNFTDKNTVSGTKYTYTIRSFAGKTLGGYSTKGTSAIAG